MSSANEQWMAERLARLLSRLEAMKSFSHPADFDETLRVVWQRGSATNGYKELSEAMSVLVASKWSALRAEAISIAQASVDAARDELRAALTTPDKQP